MSREKEGQWEQVNPLCYDDSPAVLEALLKHLNLTLYRKASLDYYGQQVVDYKVEAKK